MSRACVYCGLEVPRSWWGHAPDTETKYCCFGCRFAHAVAQERRGDSHVTLTLARLAISIFFAMNVMAFTMALWSENIYGPETESTIGPVFHNLFRYLCLLFSIPVLLLLGGPLAAEAWAGVRRGAPTTDLLLLAGVIASFAVSLSSVYRDDGPIYFEVGVVVLLLVTLGRWLEATGKQKATQALNELHKLIPETARRWRFGLEETIPSAALAIGDQLRVWPGERIPCDGRIVQHQASIDEQLVTGESTPRIKQVGDLVWGGSLLLDSELMVEATAPAQGGLINRMVESIRTATLQKGQYHHLADRAAAVFLPVVALISIAAVMHSSRTEGVDIGLMRGLAVVVIACPCAMGVATPLAVWVAVGRLARHGILVRAGAAIERLALVRTVFFDKTGTMTLGTSAVADLQLHDEADRSMVEKYVMHMTAGSLHPHAQALQQWAREQARPVEDSAQYRVCTMPGQGLVMDGDEKIFLGSWQLLSRAGCAWIGDRPNGPHPQVVIGWGGKIRGVFTMREQLRSQARPAVEHLHHQGITVELLSGDAGPAVRTIGDQLGIAAAGDLPPEDKVQRVAARRASGLVAMVGDGINDGPVLASADVGIAMGGGVELARETADVCLLTNDLQLLPPLLLFARRTVTIIRQNLFWALAYNILGIAAAWLGWLSPVLAAIAMLLSSVLVVANSLRLNHGTFAETPLATSTTP